MTNQINQTNRCSSARSKDVRAGTSKALLVFCAEEQLRRARNFLKIGSILAAYKGVLCADNWSLNARDLRAVRDS